MKVYIAAPWTRRDEAREVAASIEARGYTITHDWWNHECPDDNYRQLRDHAMTDFLAVQACDLFVLLNSEKSEGKAVETGIALTLWEATGSPLLLGVGPRYTNIFQHLAQWAWFPSPLELLHFLDAVPTFVPTSRIKAS